MAVGATSFRVNGRPVEGARIVRIDEGKDLAALDEAKASGADHIFFSMKGDLYVASAKSFELKEVDTGNPVEFGGKQGKVLFPIDHPNSLREFRQTEIPGIAKRANLGAGLEWAALFGTMGAVLGAMAGRTGAAAVKAAVAGALAFPAILVGIPVAIMAWAGYQELKLQANPRVDTIDRFGKVVN